MDRSEASAVGEVVLQELRAESYDDRARLLDKPTWESRVGPSGTEYRVQIYGLCDNADMGHVRVVVGVDDGTRGRFGFVSPVSTDFIVVTSGRKHALRPS